MDRDHRHLLWDVYHPPSISYMSSNSSISSISSSGYLSSIHHLHPNTTSI